MILGKEEPLRRPGGELEAAKSEAVVALACPVDAASAFLTDDAAAAAASVAREAEAEEGGDSNSPVKPAT